MNTKKAPQSTRPCAQGRCLPMLHAALMMIAISPPLFGAEYKRDEEGTPTNAGEVASVLERLEEDEAPMRPGIWQRRLRDWERLPQFLQEATVAVKSRTYSLDKEVDGHRTGRALATGGELSLTTGSVRGWQAGLSYFTTQEISSDEDGDDTGLLAPDQDDLTVLGKAFLRYTRDTWQLDLYRREIDLPYLNKHDIRMIPNTFEAYTLTRTGQRLGYVVGHVTKMKRRNDNAFEPMAKVAGADSNEGLSTIGARYEFTNGANVGAIVLNSWDVVRTIYAEANWFRELPYELQYKASLQLTDQRSIGDELIGDFDTSMWGARGVLSYKNAVLTASYTQTSNDANVFRPYGGTPAFNSLMINDFDRAGAKSWRVGLSYEFSRIGVKGLGITVNYAEGRDAVDPATGFDLADRDELDISLDFKPKEGRLEGFWTRLRFALTSQDAGPDVDQVRFIVNYELPFS